MSITNHVGQDSGCNPCKPCELHFAVHARCSDFETVLSVINAVQESKVLKTYAVEDAHSLKGGRRGDLALVAVHRCCVLFRVPAGVSVLTQSHGS